MKKQFSIKWKASSQKRKQRKYVFNIPLHLKRKLLSAGLSKELRKRYSRRSFPVRKGDTVRVMHGKFKGKEGKISGLSKKTGFVYIENIQITKKDGSKVNFPIRTHRLRIMELELDDRQRLASLENKKKITAAQIQEEKKK